VVSGFKPIMPTFNGLVNEDQLIALISYVKSLSQPQQNAQQAAAGPGQAPAAGNAGNEKVQ
jgi:cytochrome c oxidase subunit 2